MRYRGLYIDECETDGIIRENEGEEIECNGSLFIIYADCDYEYEIDRFVGAYGFEIGYDQESADNFVREYVDSCYEYCKKMQFAYILEKDYNSYKYDVHNCDDFSDVWEKAKEVASIQSIYESLKDSKDIPIEQMEYIISLNRPLENLYYRLEPNENQFAEDVKTAIKSVVSNEDCTFGYMIDFESRDENVLDKSSDMRTPEMNSGGMDMH